MRLEDSTHPTWPATCLEHDDNRLEDDDGYWSKEGMLKEDYTDWTLAEDDSGDSLSSGRT